MCVQCFESLRAKSLKCKNGASTNQRHLDRKEGERPIVLSLGASFSVFCCYSSVLLSVLYLNSSMSVCICVCI